MASAANTGNPGRAAPGTLQRFAQPVAGRGSAERSGRSPSAPPPKAALTWKPFLTQSRDQQQEARSRCDRCEGEMAAIGDRLEVAAQLESLEAARSQAQEEYDALALAWRSLTGPIPTCRPVFRLYWAAGPARSSTPLPADAISMYSWTAHCTLQRKIQLPFPRSAALLSQGAADQLYLALRLAISELVLPADKRVPLILDDTLTNFDGRAAPQHWTFCAPKPRGARFCSSPVKAAKLSIYKIEKCAYNNIARNRLALNGNGPLCAGQDEVTPPPLAA